MQLVKSMPVHAVNVAYDIREREKYNKLGNTNFGTYYADYFGEYASAGFNESSIHRIYIAYNS